MSRLFKGRRVDRFCRQYKAFSGAFCTKRNVDDGGKIILPASALQILASLNIVYPMLFRLTNPVNKKHTHCGVLEFSAKEGIVFIPFWMQQFLCIQPGQIITIENATLNKGKFVKIRPQKKAFVENITNPKAVLERKLRNFTCLTKGDTIIIYYNNKSYCIDIIECKDHKGSCSSISIVEADVEVEFDKPLDMPSPKAIPKPKPKPFFTDKNVGVDKKKKSKDKKKNDQNSKKKKDNKEEEEEEKFTPFAGSGYSITGKKFLGNDNMKIDNDDDKGKGKDDSEKKKKFKAFTGTGLTVSGKGKIMNNNEISFGSKKKKKKKKKNKKFEAFGGEGRSLK